MTEESSQYYFDVQGIDTLQDLVAQGRITPEIAAKIQGLSGPPLPLPLRPESAFIPPEVLTLSPPMPTPVPTPPYITLSICCGACLVVSRIAPALPLPTRCTGCGRPWTAAQYATLLEDYAVASGALTEYTRIWDEAARLYHTLLEVQVLAQDWRALEGEPAAETVLAHIDTQIAPVRQALEGEGTC